MDELEAIERLAGRAREERPAVAVNAVAVLAAIRAGRPLTVLPLSFVAAGAALAAVVVMTLAIHAWSAGVDPQAALFPILEAAQP
jgi:hypothetical protein